MAERILVKKTYKLYIGGKFPRSESGATLAVEDRKGKTIASYCKASRKDFRDAVLAADSGAKAWKAATAYLRGQILYRAAEMLEGREAQFVEELQLHGLGKSAAKKEVQAAVDRLVYYAGWTDKVGQLFSSVNPVASPHFCFTVPEPTGVVAILLGEGTGFVDMAEAVGRVLSGGNSAILVSGNKYPLAALTMGEVWQTSDLPAGVLNILTAPVSELVPTVSSHRAVDGILGVGLDKEIEKSIQEAAADSLKRLRFEESKIVEGSPYGIADFLEMKTTWHPVGV
jgi:acyl-CoA reductase-like NAD-dependent aldehyde dehydrogenase